MYYRQAIEPSHRSNKTYDDIWMRSGLEQYAQEHPGRFKMWNILSIAPEDLGWKVRGVASTSYPIIS